MARTLTVRRLSEALVPEPMTLPEYRAHVARKRRRLAKVYRPPEAYEGMVTCVACRKPFMWNLGQFDDGMCIECQYAMFHSPEAIAHLFPGKRPGIDTIGGEAKP